MPDAPSSEHSWQISTDPSRGRVVAGAVTLAVGGATSPTFAQSSDRRPPLQGVFFCDIQWKGLFSIPGRKVQSLQTNTGFECTEVAPNFAQ
jgi:hypothetical protein